MRASKELRDAYVQFIAGQGGTHAVTLAYNTRYGGTSFACVRVNAAGQRFQIAGARDASSAGWYRMPTIRHVPLEQVQKDVRHLQALVESGWFGRQFHRVSPDQRGRYIGLTENEQSNIHVHLAWRVPDKWAASFSDAVVAAWRRMQPFGSCSIEAIKDDGWARYLTKKLNDGEAAAFIASTP